MNVRSLAATLLLALASTTSHAAKSAVRIDNGGRGLADTLNLPDNGKNPPIVLMLHGFTGQKNEFPIAGQRGSSPTLPQDLQTAVLPACASTSTDRESAPAPGKKPRSRDRSRTPF